MRTGIDALRAEDLSWASWLRVTVANSGQTKLADFARWDLIAQYYDSTGNYHSAWLPYTSGTPGDNEWAKARICLHGQPETFEPGILNPWEEMAILARLSPPPGADTTGNIVIAAPNGIEDSAVLYSAGYTLLIPHAESKAIAATRYYELAEGAPADGAGMTETTDIFLAGETNRKIMHNENDSSRPAHHIFSLTGISHIPEAEWTVYYHGRTLGFQAIDDNEAQFNIDIIILKADGTLRDNLATAVANAYLTSDEVDTWLTKSATYHFPGYTVVDDSDYLDVVFYGETAGDGPSGSGYMQIRIDDNTLAREYQTRIEA